MTIEELSNMQLHETIKVSDNLVVIKVHGGWLYRTTISNNQVGPTGVALTFVSDRNGK